MSGVKTCLGSGQLGVCLASIFSVVFNLYHLLMNNGSRVSIILRSFFSVNGFGWGVVNGGWVEFLGFGGWLQVTLCRRSGVRGWTFRRVYDISRFIFSRHGQIVLLKVMMDWARVVGTKIGHFWQKWQIFAENPKNTIYKTFGKYSVKHAPFYS